MGRWIDEGGTALYVSGLLKAMALSFNLDSGLKKNLYRWEGSERLPFSARLQFNTETGGSPVFITIEGGRMKAGTGLVECPDLVVTLRNAAFFRSFFSPFNPADPFTLMLANDLHTSGNLSYLSKFGHMVAVFRDRNWRERCRGNQLDAKDVETGEALLKNSLAGKKHGLLHCAATPECAVLEDAYLSRYTIDDFPGLARQRAAFFGARATVCTERARLITQYCLKNGFERDAHGREIDPYARQGGMLGHVMCNKEAIVRDGALLAGSHTTKNPGVIIFPELSGTAIWAELSNVNRRAMNPYNITGADADILSDEVFPYWAQRNVREWVRRNYGEPRCQQMDERWVIYFMWKVAAVSHTIPDYPLMLAKGLNHIRAHAVEAEAAARDERGRCFNRAVRTVIDGVINYAGRLADKAEAGAARLGPREEARRAELLEMARICRKVPAGPAESLHEAVQSLYIAKIALHMENMNAGLSVGRIDKWLQPYFLMDAAKAKNSAEREEVVRRAIELTGSYFLQLNDHLPMVPDVGNRLFGGSSSDMALTIGGVDSDGNSAVCDMTYVILKVAEMLTLRDPNLNARFHPQKNSAEYLRRLCEVNVITGATPSIHNDAAVIASVVNQGIPERDARDWGATGCVEPTICGKHYGHTNCMMLNSVAALEMALNDGVHPLLREQVGPRTGDVTGFATFDSFKAAYKTQLKFIIDRSVEYNNLLGTGHQRLHPTPLLSSMIGDCIDSGRDAIDGGATFNSSGAAVVSIVDVVDSLLAVDKLVFRDRTVTFGELRKALEGDFAGYGKLQALMEKKAPKFGSGSVEARVLMQEMVDFAYDCYNRSANYRGGRYTAGFWSMSNHVAFGTLSGALPSGRKKGKAFTPGITPSAAASTNLLDNLRDVAGLNPLKMPNNIAFNVKLSPAPGETHEHFVDHVAAYTRTYFELGGMQIQFNMVTSEMLRDAMAHPESYRNLMVRISGYNAYFVDLNREMQIELIERAEYR
jgi:formate C-acetyltransferase